MFILYNIVKRHRFPTTEAYVIPGVMVDAYLLQQTSQLATLPQKGGFGHNTGGTNFLCGWSDVENPVQRIPFKHFDWSVKNG